MADNGPMGTKTSNSDEMEALRSKLREMGRPAALQLAKDAGIPASTMDKFRNAHFADLGGDKVLALQRELEAREVAAHQTNVRKPVKGSV